MAERQQSFSVPAEAEGMRLDRFLGTCISECSRARLKKSIEAGDCCVNGMTVQDASSKVHAGQTVAIQLPDAACTLHPENGELEVLWHDEHIAVINKPAGLTVHPCPSCPEGTLVHRLLSRFPEIAAQEGPRPGIVHRLDKDTSGLIAVALTDAARLRMSAAFAERQVHKEYLALVYGVPEQEGRCDAPIGRHPQSKVKMTVLPENRGGRSALTTWRVVWTAPNRSAALVAVRIHTGRTHQIRVHFAYTGHPLLGDAVYGPADAADRKTAVLAASRVKAVPSALRPSRQMLHARHLTLQHPMSGEELSFQCPPPADMEEAVVSLSLGRMQRIVITGNPGCGKSTLTHMLKQRGWPVFSADAEVAKLYAGGGTGADFLRQRFGSKYVTDEGEVNRSALLTAMRDSPALRREVEAYIHTLVLEAMERFWQQAEADGARFAAAEVPLFFEAGWHRNEPAPVTVCVACPMPLRHARLLETRGWSAERSAAVEGWQWPELRKQEACDIVTDNSGTLEDFNAAADNTIQNLEERIHGEELKLRRQLSELWHQ